MKFNKKTALIATLFASAILTGCQNSANNTLTFTTPAPTSSFNTNNQSAVVNVQAQDLRPSAEVASYTTAGNVTRLTSVPTVTQLFQQAMQQNLNSKGFTVVQGASNANVTVNIKRFFATVEQGNLLHKITTNIDLEIAVQGLRGSFSKTFSGTRTLEGAFGATNARIQQVLGQTYTEMIQSIYNDNEISNAIHQFK